MQVRGKLDRSADPDRLATATLAAIQDGLVLTPVPGAIQASSPSPSTPPTPTCALTQPPAAAGANRTQRREGDLATAPWTLSTTWLRRGGGDGEDRVYLSAHLLR
jgi:hypothetical protein